MTKTYDDLIHSAVTLEGMTFDERPLSILHTTGLPHVTEGTNALRVWVQVSYADTLPPEALPVGDGTNHGFDHHGCKIVSVPATLCRFLTDEEVEQAEAMAHIDAQLLSYAR